MLLLLVLQPLAPVDASPDWEDAIIQEVFQFSLTPVEKQNLGVRYLYLEQSATEAIPDATGKRLLSRDDLDSAIIERLNLPFVSHLNPFIYLVNCFDRAQNALELLPGYDNVYNIV